jgi:hypothetical protein
VLAGVPWTLGSSTPFSPMPVGSVCESGLLPT